MNHQFKKNLLAATLLLLTAGAAQAETTLYGSIRYEYQNINTYSNMSAYQKGSGEAGYRFTGSSLSNLLDAGSRIGVRGSEDLGNNNSLIYNLEWKFNGMEANQPGTSDGKGFKTHIAYMGITGDWGTFKAGRQDNPFEAMITDYAVTDNFNGEDVIDVAAQRAMTSALNGTGLSALTGNSGAINLNDPEADYSGVSADIANTDYSELTQAIVYRSPIIGGFHVNAGLMMDGDMYGQVNNRKSVDLWTINGHYRYELGHDGAIFAGLGFTQAKVANNGAGSEAWKHKNNSNVFGASLSYISRAIELSATYANGNYKPTNYDSKTDTYSNGDKLKSQGWDLGAQYSFGRNYDTTVRVGYGESQVKQAGQKDKVESWAVGLQQNFSTRTWVWLEYGYQKTKFANPALDPQKMKVVSIGLWHDF